MENQKIRLEKDFIPLHYDINLDIDIINLSYISKVEITLESQIDNPKYFKVHERRIRLLNKKLSRQILGSKNRQKTINLLNKEYKKAF